MARFKFTEKQKEDIKNQALQFWDESSQQRTDYFFKVNDYLRMYHVKLPKELDDEMSTHDDRSSLVPPDIYNNVLSLRAAIKALIFGKKPYGIVSLDGQIDNRSPLAQKAERKLTELIDIGNFTRASDKCVTQAAIAGLGCGFTEWHKVYRQVPMRGDKSNKITGIERREVAAYPRCKPLDIRRVRIDDKAETSEDIRIAAYHARVNLTDLIVMNDDANNPMTFDAKKLDETSFDSNKFYEFVNEEDNLYGHKDETDYGDKSIELMDFRGIFKIDKKYMDLIVKIGNREIVLEARENDLPIPGWELFTFPSIDEEVSRLYPMGVVEPAMDIFLEEWLKRNQSLDASNRNTYDQYIADSAAVQELPDRIPYIGGGIIKLHLGATGAASVSQVFAPMPRAVNQFDTFQQSASLKGEVQQTMRQNDFKQGSDPARKETATAVTELVIGGQRLDEQVVEHLKDTFYSPMWRNFLILWDFFKGGEASHVTGDDGEIIEIFPGELSFPFNVTIDVSSAVERPIMQRRIVESYPFLKDDPFWDQYQLRKTFAWALNLPNPDRLLPNPGWRESIPERENIAMLNAVPIPVHPLDAHQQHVKSHQTRMQEIAQTQTFSEVDMGRILGVFDTHLKQHMDIIEQQSPGAVHADQGGGKSGDSNQGQMAGGADAKIPNVNVAQPSSSRG